MDRHRFTSTDLASTIEANFQSRNGAQRWNPGGKDRRRDNSERNPHQSDTGPAGRVGEQRDSLEYGFQAPRGHAYPNEKMVMAEGCCYQEMSKSP